MALESKSEHQANPEVFAPPLAVTVAWLTRELRGSTALRLIDVSLSAQHRKNLGYLPRAVPVDLESLFKSGPAGAPDPLLFAATLSQAGVSDDDTIVTYDDGEDSRARLLHYWLCRYGHERSYYLVGGRSEWLLRGQQLVAKPERAAASSFTVKIAGAKEQPTDEDVLLSYRSKKRAEKKRAA
jgi:3-mercaptopyruvate sulfurtransferase SseA